MKNGNEGISNLAEIENLNKQIEKLNQQIKELMNHYEKELALVREDAQVEIMRRDLRITQLEKIEKEHQDLNGKLRLEITRLKGGL